MNKKNRLKILIGVLCVVLVLLVTLAARILDSQAPDPIGGVFQTESTTATEKQQDPTESTTATEKRQDPTESTTATEKRQDPTEATTATEKQQDPTESTAATEEQQDPPESTAATEEQQDPTTSTEEQQDPSEPTTPIEEQPTLPEEQPPSVVIPPEEDSETGEELGISFPCQIPEYDLTIEKMAPYNGIFVEDGSNANIENVAMLLVENNGVFPVEYAQIRVVCGQEELLFDISALPAGEKLVVQEKTGKTISEDKVSSASALVVQRANMEMSESKVQVIDNGDNTLTVKNLTTETIPSVRIFYKYYMEDEELFVGGIAFTVRIARLGAGASVTIQPSHYTSQTSRVVMVLTYDSEV